MTSPLLTGIIRSLMIASVTSAFLAVLATPTALGSDTSTEVASVQPVKINEYAPFTPPITSIHISYSGLSEYVRSFSVKSNDTSAVQVLEVVIPTRTSTLDDVLQSILVDGEGIEYVEISTPSPHNPSPINLLPIKPGDLRSNAALLAALTGKNLTINNNMTGTLLGVTKPCDMDGTQRKPSGETCGGEILLLDEGTVYPLALASISSIGLSDADSEEILKTLRLAHHSPTVDADDPITQVNLTIKRLREYDNQMIHITTVVPAPLWKPSYRAMLNNNDTLELGLWMVMENHSLEDWNHIDISLVSGDGNSYKGQLSQRIFANRQHISYHRSPAIHAETSNESSSMSLDSTRQKTFSTADDKHAESASDDSLPYPDVSIAQSAKLVSHEHGSVYHLPHKLNVKKGDLVSVPILSEPFGSALLNYYHGQAHRGLDSWLSPNKVLALRNTLSIRLPSGVATLFSQAGRYLGDMHIPEMDSGEYRLMTIGEASQIRVRQLYQFDQQKQVLSLADGLIQSQSEDIHRTTYQIEGSPDEATQLTLFHPESPGFAITSISSNSAAGEEPVKNLDDKKVILNRHQSGYEIKIELEAGEKKALVVVETMPSLTEFKLEKLGQKDIELYIASDSTQQQLSIYLKQLLELKKNVQNASHALDDYQAQRNHLVSEQKRISELLTNIAENTEAYQNFSQSLIDYEKQIQAWDLNHSQLKITFENAKDALRKHLESTPDDLIAP